MGSKEPSPPNKPQLRGPSVYLERRDVFQYVGFPPIPGGTKTQRKGLRSLRVSWMGGGAVKQMRRSLEKEKFEVWEKELQVQYLPSAEELKKAVQFGKEFAKKALGQEA